MYEIGAAGAVGAVDGAQPPAPAAAAGVQVTSPDPRGEWSVN